VQTKLAEDIEKKFSNVSKRFEALSADLRRTSQANEDTTKDVAGLSTSIDSLQEGIGLLQGQVLSERSRLDKATQTIDSIGSQIQLVTNETTQLNERLQSGEKKLDETTKLTEQALDDKASIIAVEVLAEEVVTKDAVKRYFVDRAGEGNCTSNDKLGCLAWRTSIKQTTIAVFVDISRI